MSTTPLLVFLGFFRGSERECFSFDVHFGLVDGVTGVSSRIVAAASEAI